MEIPNEFKTFASFFDFEVRDALEPTQDLIGFALNCIDKKDKGAVETFLTKVLRSDASPEEIHKMWLQSGARVAFSDYKPLFQEIVQRIKAQ